MNGRCNAEGSFTPNSHPPRTTDTPLPAITCHTVISPVCANLTPPIGTCHTGISLPVVRVSDSDDVFFSPAPLGVPDTAVFRRESAVEDHPHDSGLFTALLRRRSTSSSRRRHSRTPSTAFPFPPSFRRPSAAVSCAPALYRTPSISGIHQ